MQESHNVEAAIAAYRGNPTALPLHGAVQHYDWGGFTFIPDLLGVDNAARQPFAELWIGANTGAPSIVDIGGQTAPLDKLVDAAPEASLGASIAHRFSNRLPYLFKVLDARKMLSIQAHPTKQQAEEGYARENAAGVSLKAPNRNYKDDNHKPEVHVALTDFWMLHGFRPLEETAGVLSSVPEFAVLAPDFTERLAAAGRDAEARRETLRALYARVMQMPQGEVDRILNPLIARLEGTKPTDKDAPDYWALRAAETFPLPDGHRDRGIFSIYLLNLVHLKPGQGTYQPAGMLHAYLEGVNMELMANSDNVLRGGLTPKHVDVGELMKTLTFDSGPSQVLHGDPIDATETVYRTAAREFELSRIRLASGADHAAAPDHGPDALIVLEGAADLKTPRGDLRLNRGQIAFVPAALPYTLESGSAMLFKASVPAR
ncbi:MAG TPA: mannose-6-phosphate isomerase, class I [Armatimonadota bacterium]|jgi:mannose-6-phosphate isomerase class I